ncbi:MAG: hypothetical protein HQL06_05715 [Nitrospirae bacterium]|nr:hypothetical protein [Nitrospirota bacterium]
MKDQVIERLKAVIRYLELQETIDDIVTNSLAAIEELTVNKLAMLKSFDEKQIENYLRKRIKRRLESRKFLQSIFKDDLECFKSYKNLALYAFKELSEQFQDKKKEIVVWDKEKKKKHLFGLREEKDVIAWFELNFSHPEHVRIFLNDANIGKYKGGKTIGTLAKNAYKRIKKIRAVSSGI